jgi:uncharacterized protein YaiL (DUF2058 family)
MTGTATRRFQEDLDEESLFGIAANEIAAQTISPGLYAKALAESEGDEAKARARYITLRVDMLRSERNALLEQKTLQLQLEEQRRLKEREQQQKAQAEAQKAYIERPMQGGRDWLNMLIGLAAIGLVIALISGVVSIFPIKIGN